jgi:Co/Zn/Cd efflux system component
MDCPSEENLIRTAFASYSKMPDFEFDIPNRTVHVYHVDAPDKVEATMSTVGLGSQRLSSDRVDEEDLIKLQNDIKENDSRETLVLKWLLGINAVMFLFELTVGILAQSAGLIADSLDMFADAAVYLVALFAVGKAAKHKLKAAHLSGWLQLVLAAGLLTEVIRRTFMGSDPVSMLMVSIGFVALVANVICLIMIFKVRNNGTHMKASMIFSANDVLANLGVIVAGVTVALTGSQIPDLIIGIVITGFVLWGATRILRLK